MTRISLDEQARWNTIHLAEALAAWAVRLDPTAEDLDLAERALLDTMAVTLAARDHPLVQVAGGLQDAARWASIGHVLDFDDLTLDVKAPRGRAVLEALLERADVFVRAEPEPACRARSEVLDEHPVLAGRDRWREVDTPAGTIRALLPPVTLRNVEPRMAAVPGLGQHTPTILRELGYSADDIDALHADGVV